MPKIVKKTFSFDVDTLEGAIGFNIYCVKKEGDGATLTYDKPHLFIPVVEGKLTYSVVFPDQIPVTEGQYQIGVTAVDAEDNELDFVVLDYAFDFTPPKGKISNLRMV